MEKVMIDGKEYLVIGNIEHLPQQEFSKDMLKKNQKEIPTQEDVEREE
jgi:hypothetical protein